MPPETRFSGENCGQCRLDQRNSPKDISALRPNYCFATPYSRGVLEGMAVLSAESHLPCGCGKSDKMPPKDEQLFFGGADVCLLATGAEQRG